MPSPDQLPSPRHAMMRHFWRVFRLLALLSIAIAAIAVVLVARGDSSPLAHPHMLIATALGIALLVLIGTGLMALVFFSNSSGHDEAASRVSEEIDHD